MLVSGHAGGNDRMPAGDIGYRASPHGRCVTHGL